MLRKTMALHRLGDYKATNMLMFESEFPSLLMNIFALGLIVTAPLQSRMAF